MGGGGDPVGIDVGNRPSRGCFFGFRLDAIGPITVVHSAWSDPQPSALLLDVK